MSTQYHIAHYHKARQFWLKEEPLLGTLAAFFAFALIYVYSGDADLYCPFVGRSAWAR